MNTIIKLTAILSVMLLSGCATIIDALLPEKIAYSHSIDKLKSSYQSLKIHPPLVKQIYLEVVDTSQYEGRPPLDDNTILGLGDESSLKNLSFITDEKQYLNVEANQLNTNAVDTSHITTGTEGQYLTSLGQQELWKLYDPNQSANLALGQGASIAGGILSAGQAFESYVYKLRTKFDRLRKIYYLSELVKGNEFYKNDESLERELYIKVEFEPSFYGEGEQFSVSALILRNGKIVNSKKEVMAFRDADDEPFPGWDIQLRKTVIPQIGLNLLLTDWESKKIEGTDVTQPLSFEDVGHGALFYLLAYTVNDLLLEESKKI